MTSSSTKESVFPFGLLYINNPLYDNLDGWEAKGKRSRDKSDYGK